MKYLLGAAAAAIALSTVSSSGHANNTSWAMLTSADQQAHEVNGLDHLWSAIKLKHRDITVHLPSGVILFPPDPIRGCDRLAVRWDVAVLTGARPQRFEHLLSRMAKKQCTITFEGGGGNSDGSTDMVTVKPGQ